MKLSRSKLTETLRKLADGKTVYQARKVARIGVRRVYQVKGAFDKTGEIPQIGNDVGRPRKPFEEWEFALRKGKIIRKINCDGRMEIKEYDFVS